MSGNEARDRVDLSQVASEYLSREVLKAVEDVRLIVAAGEDEFFVAIRGKRRPITRLLVLVVVMVVLYVL